jgi:hypothetical protein
VLLVTVISLEVLELLTMELVSAVVAEDELLVVATLEEVDSVVAGVLVLAVELVVGYKVD